MSKKVFLGLIVLFVLSSLLLGSQMSRSAPQTTPASVDDEQYFVQTPSESIFTSSPPEKKAELKVYTEDGKPAFELQLIMASDDLVGAEETQLLRSVTDSRFNFLLKLTVPAGWSGGLFNPDRLFLEIADKTRFSLGRIFQLSLNSEDYSPVSGSIFECFMGQCNALDEGDSFSGIYSFPSSSSLSQVRKIRRFLEVSSDEGSGRLYLYYKGGGPRVEVPVGLDIDRGLSSATGTTLEGPQTNSQNVGERIQVSEAVAPGDVVGLDPNRSNHYRRTREPYSKLVAGVIIDSPIIELGRSGESIDGPVLTLSGTAKVNASAENGPIRPGDLLTPSSRPGYAMACKNRDKCAGAIVGKALDTLEKGEGKINMLVVS